MAEETGEAIDARQTVVSIALSQEGIQDPDKYWSLVCKGLMGNPHTISWCGGFALWCLRQAHLCDWDWIIWKGPGTPSGFCFRLSTTRDPQPGDIAYFIHNQHHAVVRRVEGDTIFTIDGNSMPAPLEGVVAKERHLKDVSLFYSIAELIS